MDIIIHAINTRFNIWVSHNGLNLVLRVSL